MAKKSKKNEVPKKEKLVEFCEKHDLKMLYVLWLIKKYNLPYPKNESNIDNIAFIMRAIFETDTYNIVNVVDEYQYADFIKNTVDFGIYNNATDEFDKEYNEILLKRNEKTKTEAANIFAQYLSDSLLFDREFPGRAEVYWPIVENFISDIENTAQYNLRNSATYWSLLCNIAGSYDDIDPEFKNAEHAGKAVKYINRALEVRANLFGKKDSDEYFKSESYAIDLNNIGYTLIHLDGNKYVAGQYGSFENLIRKIYDEISMFLRTATNLRWKALVISNLGAIAGKYGNHAEAVRYDLQALELKESLVKEDRDNNIRAKKDLLLTTLKSHLNIVNNSLMALFELQLVYGMKEEDFIPAHKLEEYITLIGTHAVEAVRLRKQIDSEVIAVKEDGKKQENDYPNRVECARQLKRVILRTEAFLTSVVDDVELANKEYTEFEKNLKSNKGNVVIIENKRQEAQNIIKRIGKTGLVLEKNKPIDGVLKVNKMISNGSKWLEELKKYRPLVEGHKKYISGVHEYLMNSFEEYKNENVSVYDHDIVIRTVRY